MPDLLPFRRLRDLLQYYRGSLIGTPDLIRDIGAPNRREILGALKALLAHRGQCAAPYQGQRLEAAPRLVSLTPFVWRVGGENQRGEGRLC